MSDIEIVSVNNHYNGDEGIVPAGTVWFDVDPADLRSQESRVGVPAVDWRGLDDE